MFAIVECGSKQFKVEKDKTYQIDKVTAQPGEEVILEKVLLIGDGDACTIGKPTIPDAKVITECVQTVKGDKVISFKFRRRKHSHRIKGHRQQYTVVKVKEIVG